MRRRSRTHNLGNVIPPVTVKPDIAYSPAKKMTYNRSERNANFYLDLLADKMDVLQRKADMYMLLGEKDALNAIMSSWNRLHALYNSLLSPNVSRAVDTKFVSKAGDKLPSRLILSQIQKAMDLADSMMKKAGETSFQKRQSMIEGLQSEVANLNAAIEQSNAISAGLRSDISALNEAHALGLASKDEEIANLISELEGEQSRVLDLQAAKDSCEQQVASLSAELEEIKEPLVLQSSAFTLGGEGGGPLSLDISNRAKVVEAINSRDNMIDQLRSNIAKLDSLRAENIENAKKIADAERLAASAASEADKYKKITIGVIVAGVAACGGVYYMSRK